MEFIDVDPYENLIAIAESSDAAKDSAALSKIFSSLIDRAYTHSDLKVATNLEVIRKAVFNWFEEDERNVFACHIRDIFNLAVERNSLTIVDARRCLRQFFVRQ